MSSNTTTPRFFDLHDLQTDQGREMSGTNGCCILCGKRVRADRKKTVECINGGLDAIHNDDQADSHDPGYMGVFDIGPHCARKIPTDYLKPGNY